MISDMLEADALQDYAPEYVRDRIMECTSHPVYTTIQAYNDTVPDYGARLSVRWDLNGGSAPLFQKVKETDPELWEHFLRWLFDRGIL